MERLQKRMAEEHWNWRHFHSHPRPTIVSHPSLRSERLGYLCSFLLSCLVLSVDTFISINFLLSHNALSWKLYRSIFSREPSFVLPWNGSTTTQHKSLNLAKLVHLFSQVNLHRLICDKRSSQVILMRSWWARPTICLLSVAGAADHLTWQSLTLDSKNSHRHWTRKILQIVIASSWWASPMEGIYELTKK